MSKKMKLKSYLEVIYKEFNQAHYIETDPIRYPHQFRSYEDQELAAWLASIFSYGNIASIFKVLDQLFDFLGPSPARNLKQISQQKIKSFSQSTYYRFYRSQDIEQLLLVAQEVLQDYASLRDFYQDEASGIYSKDLKSFQDNWLKRFPNVTYGVRYMFPDPDLGASKRLHMLMRWIVRKDRIDLGLWNFIKPNDLIAPIDTHLLDISKKLELTKLKTSSKQTALQVTQSLRDLHPDDPIRYDFGLCRVGILRLKNEFLSSQVAR